MNRNTKEQAKAPITNYFGQSFDSKIGWGQDGEDIICKYFTDMSASVFPTTQYGVQKWAPMTMTHEGTISSPDMYVFFGGKAIMVDCKMKNKWVEFNGATETGFDQKHYLNYKKLSDDSGIPLYVFFIQCNSDHTKYEVYSTEIHNTNYRVWEACPMNHNSALVLFTSESLTRVFEK